MATYQSQSRTFSNSKPLAISQICHMILLSLHATIKDFTAVWILLSCLMNPFHPSTPNSKVTSLCSLSWLFKHSLLCIALALYSKFILQEAEHLETRTLSICLSQHPALAFTLNR